MSSSITIEIFLEYAPSASGILWLASFGCYNMQIIAFKERDGFSDLSIR